MKIYACKNRGKCVGSIVSPYTLHIGRHDTPESAKEACNRMLGCGIVEMNVGPRVRCRACGVTIISLHRHDFITCECGALSDRKSVV